MARIRTVKPEFWQHPKVCRVSRDARLLFLGLLNEADDEGKLRYSAKRLAGVVFPLDDDVSSAKLDRWTSELERESLVHRYSVDGADLLMIVGFAEHQKINRPTRSRLPNPGEGLTEPSVSPHGALTEGSLGEQGTGNREQGSARERAVKESYEEDFGAWYAAYPRKVDRADALKAYRARRREGATAEELLAAAEAYATKVEGKAQEYVKYPKTFLAKDGPWTEVHDTETQVLTWDDPEMMPR